MRFDFVPSYWLLTWWVLYYTGVLPFNPKLFLVAGLIENTIQMFVFPPESIQSFLLVNVFIKLIPLLFVWNTVSTKRDIVFGLFLGLVYLVWIKLNRQDVFKIRTPLTDFLRKYNLLY